MFNVIARINELKTSTKRITYVCKLDLIEENLTQINGGITINVDMNVKNVMYLKKLMVEILLHVAVKKNNI